MSSSDSNGSPDPAKRKPAPRARKRDHVLPYEAPDDQRPASSTPTEQQLERELPGGRTSRFRGHDPYAALRLKNYRLYAAAFWMSVIGGQTQNVAVGWEIYNRTN